LKVSIVVPAFNEERLLAATLREILAAARSLAGPWELVVCDNNSTDGTPEIARAAGARVVYEPHNQISRARNTGARAAAGEWLVFIDADSTPSPGLFADMQAAIDSGRVLAGGSTLVPDSSSAGYRAAIRAWNAISRATKRAAGSFIFVEAAVFREAGGFSEELYASEELELFTRLKRLARERGRRIVILDRHPIRTSDRKVRLYGWGGLLRAAGGFLLHPRRALRDPKLLRPWYDGRR
jgi:glycosyltransferase involved in cell wall biosynthesis